MSQHISRNVVRPFQRRGIIRPHTVRHMASQRDNGRVPEFESPDTLREKAQIQDPRQFEKHDFGMLPGTFIRAWDTTPPLLPRPLYPLAKDRFKRALADRWKYEKTWFLAKMKHIYGMLTYKLIRGIRGPKPKGVFWHATVGRRADELYEKLYDAFASKDTTHLKDFCTDGLLMNVNDRVSGRPKEVKMTWRLIGRDRWPQTRVVSNQFGYLPLPGAEDKDHPYAVRQLVLRKSTRQLLTIERQQDAHVTSSGRTHQKRRLAWTPDSQPEAQETAIEGKREIHAPIEKHDKKVVEYVVLQQVMIHGNEKDWRLWGFADKTTVESIKENERKDEELAALQTRQSPLGG